jgi:imidazole glycerol phosphate synthase glutamine amidotransferase subunit
VIALIDYGSGNLRSAAKAIEAVGASVQVVDKPASLDDADAVVLPGVGAFGDASRNLDARGFREPLIEWIASDRPFLGICVGYQLLFATSEESPGARGLGVLPGKVVRFSSTTGVKVPHMGWNTLDLQPARIWRDLPPSPSVYFVHSYFPRPDDSEIVVGRSWHGEEIPAAIEQRNLAAVQFHPEKSQDNGLAILRNWVEQFVPARAAG